MTFEDIEDKIIEDLKSLTYVRIVETYAGQIEQDAEKLILPTPALLVAYAGSDYEWVDGPNHSEICNFSILAVAKNLRGQKAIRKDDSGCYQMIVDVLNLLTNKTFGLEIEKLKPMRVSLVYISKTIAVYGIDFQTNFDTTFNW